MDEFFTTERMALAIPLMGMVFLGAIALLTITFKQLRRRRLLEVCHAERMAALDKGVELAPLPDAVLYGTNPAHNPRATLLKGLIWLFGAIGAYLALYYDHSREAAFTFIPGAVGLAYLTYYFIEGRKGDAAIPPSDSEGAAPLTVPGKA